MYGLSREMSVKVWSDVVKIAVVQTSKTVWEASGEYKGQYYSTKSRSAASAAKAWADAARYHSN
jgi:hypothetical protein